MDDTVKEHEEKEVMEQNKVRQMRSLVESQDPTSKEVDDLMIRRFLRARDLDIENGSALFLKYIKWRRSFVPNGFISESEIAFDLSHKKLFLQGFDKSERPIVVTYVSKHFPNKEKGRFHSIRSRQDMCTDARRTRKFVAIADAEGWGYYSNCDVREYLAGLSVLQV
ncbi:hypothetical protein C5167_044295 [Papaver somniferum]|uniref:CRAL/TRIO N-terminal domain-containing protein n=1 Tax=Papaver somniferum TaxID=3469 RepID=A0A4Y7L9Q7_PAPSO|nr:hypothetical protein C5167_044295 [Papaver somniferum]